MNRYERESIEFQPVTVTVDGVTVTDGVTLTIAPTNTRPTDWAAPAVVAGKAGVMVQGLTPGQYNVWAKVLGAPETVVLNCGAIYIA